MTATVETTSAPNAYPGVVAAPRRQRPDAGRWVRFAVLLVFTAIVVTPIVAVVVLSLQPTLGSLASKALTLENYRTVFQRTGLTTWLRNSLLVTFVTVLAAVAVAGPAGYVLSRGRGRMVSGFALMLFIVQSLPVITAIMPLFFLFAKLQLVDNLVGIVIIYVGSTMSVATWMMAAYFDSIPVSLEEAAWVDGCSVFGGFLRVILRNSLPGVLSTAIFSFLVAWNDFLVVLVFLRSQRNYTLPIGLQTFFQQFQTDWGSVTALSVVMMLPPIILFAVLNKYFTIGGIGGALAGQ